MRKHHGDQTVGSMESGSKFTPVRLSGEKTSSSNSTLNVIPDELEPVSEEIIIVDEKGHVLKKTYDNRDLNIKLDFDNTENYVSINFSLYSLYIARPDRTC